MTEKKGFLKWLYGVFAGVANHPAKTVVPDISQADSAAIIDTCQGKDAYCNDTEKTAEVQPAEAEQEVPQTATTVSAATGVHAGHEWVDLGLSVKWATCNVGASSPEGYGDYFAWGETSPKSSYNWTNLKYCTEGDERGNPKFSKYVTNSKYGPVDNKVGLELSDDAARVNWGGDWRIPTAYECKELIDNCTFMWTTLNGENGYKVTSKSNGNSIFLPAAGFRYGENLWYAESEGYFWSSFPDVRERNDQEYCLYFYWDIVNYSIGCRFRGQSVRPVCR